MRRVIFFTLIVMIAIVLSACTEETSQSNPAVSDIPQALDSTQTQTEVNAPTELFSSDQLSLCFSYPKGYTHTSFPDDTFSITAPYLPGAGDTSGHFWLEISDSYNRSALRIADEDMTIAASQGVPRANLDTWSITLGGEEAVVVDGMPGQNLQRRVYVVHEQTLYVLAFSPTRSENKAVGDQMETLYTAVTNSWAWSPCSASE